MVRHYKYNMESISRRIETDIVYRSSTHYMDNPFARSYSYSLPIMVLPTIRVYFICGVVVFLKSMNPILEIWD